MIFEPIKYYFVVIFIVFVLIIQLLIGQGSLRHKCLDAPTIMRQICPKPFPLLPLKENYSQLPRHFPTSNALSAQVTSRIPADNPADNSANAARDIVCGHCYGAWDGFCLWTATFVAAIEIRRNAATKCYVMGYNIFQLNCYLRTVI